MTEPTEPVFDLGLLIEHDRDGDDYVDLCAVRDGERTWLTNRYWLLPDNLCRRPHGYHWRKLTADQVNGILSLEADPAATDSPALFDPFYAHYFTAAGCTVRPCVGTMPAKKRAHALIRDGVQVGLLMPVVPPAADAKGAVPFGPVPEVAAAVDVLRAALGADAVTHRDMWFAAARLVQSGALAQSEVRA